MMKNPKYHPTIYEYLRKFQQDPTSRIFAPLAEAYRKAGLVDEAIDIAREGLRVHPQFIGGRVALARALFDKQLYTQVIEELSPLVHDIPDNLVAQRLLAESFLILGRVTESLSAYKMLLFYSPEDREIGRVVQELENQSYERGALVLQSDPPQPKTPLPEFSEKPAREAIEDDPGPKRQRRIQNIEKLQAFLLKVERYRIRNELKC